MIPLKDNIPTERTAYLTYAIIAANVTIFIWQWSQHTWSSPYVVPINGELVHLSGFEESVWRLGVRPIELTSALRLEPLTPVSEWITPLTSMFLHGSWMHLLGNMLFMWIFGNNVEDAMGTARFAVFYLLCGLAGVMAQVLVEPGAAVPMVGASGAIAGVMGGYMLLYPRARVLTLIPFLFVYLVELPAFVFLGVWMLTQMLGAPGGGGTAWFAHIGGFLSGLVLVKPFARDKQFEYLQRDPGRIRYHGR
jgi:membrane associated rhomboid family serine protease